MTPPLVLSLFPGIGLLDMAFEEEGFCVVRGPDLLWGGDIRRFHPPVGKFDGVIGGPPCQFASKMRHINPLAGKKHGNLIPEFQRVVTEASPGWFVMENVEDAPLPVVPCYGVHSQLLRDFWVGGKTLRRRRISFGTHGGVDFLSRTLGIEQVALHPFQQDVEVSALAGGGNRDVPVKFQRSANGPVEKKRYGNSGKRSALGYGGNSGDGFSHRLHLQGLPADFLSEAPFTSAGKSHAVGNGVPLPMGRAVAKAVKRALAGAFRRPVEETP